MVDFYDKPPIEQRLMMDRSITVQDLFDSERRGQKAQFNTDAAGEISHLPSNFESAWTANFSRLKDSLELKGGASLSPEAVAQRKVMIEQLDDLNEMKAPERLTMFKALKNNTQVVTEAQASADRVQEAIGAGYMPAADKEQKEMVKIVSRLDPAASAFAIRTTAKALEKESDPKIKAVLEQRLEDARAMAAAPFIERARLGAILLNEQKSYQAEKTLNDALAAPVAPDAWRLASNQQLKRDAHEQSLQLHVQNNLPEIFAGDFAQLDIGHKGSVDKAALQAAQGKGDETFKALTKFLTENYSYLTRHHWPIFSKPGITAEDVKEYTQERCKTINDLKLP